MKKTKTALRGQGPYWITRADQLKALQSAVRMDIVDRLVAVGPMSVKDLAAWTGKKATPIYHHLQQLENVGLVKRTHEFGTRGRPAAVYRASGSPVRWARAPLKVSNRKPMARIGRVVASQAAKDYALGFQASNWRIEGPKRNHWVFRCVARPSPKRLEKMNALLNELGELFWTPDPSPGELSVSIACFLSPLQTSSSKRR
jgi:DNA-binding transcriptional ArsR family regulator